MGGYDTDRSPAQRLWLWLSVGLVAVLLVGGGLLAVARGGRPQPVPVAGATGTSNTDTDAAGPMVFGAPQLVDGVPWGWPLTADGAAAAALTAVAVTGQPDVVFDPDRFAQVASVVFDQAQAQVHRRQVDAARTQLELSAWADQPLSRRMYHLAPLAATVLEFDRAGTARVDVWAMTVIGVGDAGGAAFTTSTVELTYGPDGWVVTGLESVQGPTPLVQERASAPGRTRALLRDAAATLPVPIGVSP